MISNGSEGTQLLGQSPKSSMLIGSASVGLSGTIVILATKAPPCASAAAETTRRSRQLSEIGIQHERCMAFSSTRSRRSCTLMAVVVTLDARAPLRHHDAEPSFQGLSRLVEL